MNKEQFLDIARAHPGPYPRYNYYPRISDWKNNVSSHTWFETLEKQRNTEVDLYIHFPFCQSFCHFCGCNMKVGKELEEQQKYIEVLKSEIESYKLKNFKIKNLFFGGGTPNATHLKVLDNFLEFLFSHINKSDQFNFISELDLRLENSFDFIKKLKTYGLSGVSFGIQDLDSNVLNLIGRKTNVNNLLENIKDLKNLNLSEVSVDLIYGLPKQGKKSLEGIEELLAIDSIDKISFYPFAQVPWFHDYYPDWKNVRPSYDDKMSYFYEADLLIKEADFQMIGYGHYFKKSSDHFLAYQSGKINRTVMGYFKEVSETLIGCGVSAISISPTMLKKNHKIIDSYMHQKEKMSKSHLMTDEEYKTWKLLQKISCGNMEELHNIPKDLSHYFLPYITKYSLQTDPV